MTLTPRRLNGRNVLDTGAVCIGLLHEPREQEQGTHAQMIQRLLTTPLPKDWHEHPRAFYVVEPLWLKAWRFIWGRR